MNELTPEQVALYLQSTKPYLIKQLLKQADPGISYLLEMCEKLQFGKVEMTINVRGGVIEGIELTEKKKWLRTPPLDPKSTP